MTEAELNPQLYTMSIVGAYALQQALLTLFQCWSCTSVIMVAPASGTCTPLHIQSKCRGRPTTVPVTTYNGVRHVKRSKRIFQSTTESYKAKCVLYFNLKNNNIVTANYG